MCPLLSVCPSQGIYQANSVDVHVSVATQKKKSHWQPERCQEKNSCLFIHKHHHGQTKS